MAVTKIRRISSWALIITCILSAAVLLLFFLGGDQPKLNGEWWYPTHTDELLYWGYFLLGICAIGMILFGVSQFANKFKADPKSSLMTIGVVAAFALLLFITYSIGDTTPLPNINEDSQPFNVPVWLKVVQMWIYSMYILIGLAAIAMIWGAIKKVISK